MQFVSTWVPTDQAVGITRAFLHNWNLRLKMEMVKRWWLPECYRISIQFPEGHANTRRWLSPRIESSWWFIVSKITKKSLAFEGLHPTWDMEISNPRHPTKNCMTNEKIVCLLITFSKVPTWTACKRHTSSKAIVALRPPATFPSHYVLVARNSSNPWISIPYKEKLDKNQAETQVMVAFPKSNSMPQGKST